MIKNTFAFILKVCAVLSAVLTLIFSGLYLSFRWSWCLTAAISAGVTAYHFVMRLAVGWLVPAVTGYRLDYRSAWFRPRRWEPGLYRMLKLRQLKNHLPTYDPRMYDLTQNTLSQVIRNTCGAEVVHELIMVLSFLPMLLIPRFGESLVFFLTSAIAALVDSLFVMAQRYNRPRLVRIHEKQEAKAL